MTDKVSLIEVTNINSPSAASNIMANFRAIQDRLNETVSRDGLAPNFMKNVLDMNGYNIINIGAAIPGVGGGTGSGGTGGQVGSTYNLTHDGQTDQTEDFVDAIETAVASGETFMKFLRPADATGPLYLDERASLRSETVNNIVIDLSDIDLAYSQFAEIFLQGEFVELPEEDIMQLVVDAPSGSSSITVDVRSSANLTLLNTYNTGVLRGENDVFGVALTDQREVVTWTDVDSSGGLESVVLTLASPLEFDYFVIYPDSEHSPGESGEDRSLLTVRVGQELTSNALDGAETVEADLSDFEVGDYVIIDGLTTTGDSNLQLPTGEDIRRITHISGDVARLNRPISRDMLTANGSAIFKIVPVKNVHIIGPRSIDVIDPPVGGRKHLIHGQYCAECSVSNFFYDADDSTDDVKGQVVRWARSIDCSILNCEGRNRKYITAGDGNMFAAFYSNGILVSGCKASRGRHHYIMQGGSDVAFVNNDSSDSGTNAFDTHGVGENRVYIAGNRMLPGATMSPDTTNQIGITVGNTRWRKASRNVFIANNTAYGFADAAVQVRAPSAKVSCLFNKFNDCGYGFRASIDRRAGTLTMDDLRVAYNDFTNSGVNDVSLEGLMPAWDEFFTYNGTEARPMYVRNAGNIYSTTTTKLGGSAPTHGAGETDDWAFVDEESSQILSATVAYNLPLE